MRKVTVVNLPTARASDPKSTRRELAKGARKTIPLQASRFIAAGLGGGEACLPCRKTILWSSQAPAALELRQKPQAHARGRGAAINRPRKMGTVYSPRSALGLDRSVENAFRLPDARRRNRRDLVKVLAEMKCVGHSFGTHPC